MANKRHKPEEIVTKLRQVEVLVGQGKARIDAIREVRITEQTFYRWRKQYGGMGTVAAAARAAAAAAAAIRRRPRFGGAFLAAINVVQVVPPTSP